MIALEKILGILKGKEGFAIADRNFTKLEIEVNNHETQINSLASKVIKESGSNENGRYIKFDDGTMICYAENNVALNNASVQSFTFPASFTSLISISIEPNNAGVVSAGERIGASLSAVRYSATTGWRIRFNTPTTNEYIYQYGMLAIGRWK